MTFLARKLIRKYTIIWANCFPAKLKINGAKDTFALLWVNWLNAIIMMKTKIAFDSQITCRTNKLDAQCMWFNPVFSCRPMMPRIIWFYDLINITSLTCSLLIQPKYYFYLNIHLFFACYINLTKLGLLIILIAKYSHR